MVGVEQWAELRRLHFVRGFRSVRSTRHTGFIATRSAVPEKSNGPRHQRPPKGSKPDPFKGEIHRLLADDPRLPGVVVREKLEALRLQGSRRSSMITCAPG